MLFSSPSRLLLSLNTRARHLSSHPPARPRPCLRCPAVQCIYPTARAKQPDTLEYDPGPHKLQVEALEAPDAGEEHGGVRQSRDQATGD